MSDQEREWRATPAELTMRRERMGLTQTELGKLLGVGDRAVRRWEKSDREMSGPPELRLVELEGRFETSVDALTGVLIEQPFGERMIGVYRNDAALRAAEPETVWPASILRAVAWEAAARTPFATVAFLPEPPHDAHCGHDHVKWSVPTPTGLVCAPCGATVADSESAA